MSAGIVWRNLSVPQRKALRQLHQVKTATAGWDGEISTRLARNLVELGAAALAPGSRADCRSSWWPRGTEISITAAGRAAVAGQLEKVPQPAAVARSRKVPQRKRAGR